MPATVIVVHYNEIALKGGNRSWFESRLRENLAEALKGVPGTKVRREHGRIVAVIHDASPAAAEEACARVAKVPGIAWFAAAEQVERTMEAIEAAVLARAAKETGTFAVHTRRADKTFPLISMEVNRRIGAAVVVATGRKVNLTAPEEIYGIEIGRDFAFVLGHKREGPGGLPVGTAGRVVALLSGGIDSPVAAWRMMKRGCRVMGVHFFNNAAGGEGVKEKLDLLGEVLAPWQGHFTIRIVPFERIQRAIVAAVPADHRMVVYRRAMLRLADRIRGREECKAMVTGDSVGQVASQTLENLACVYAAVPGLVLSPLCGMDKIEVIEEARRIGTYEPSILPHEDCCSFLIDAHPVTRAVRHEVEEMEKTVAWGTLLDEAIQGIEIRRYPAGAAS